MSDTRWFVVIGSLVMLLPAMATAQKPQPRTTLATGDIAKGNAAAADGARLQRIQPGQSRAPSTTNVDRELTDESGQGSREENLDALTELAIAYRQQIATLNQLLPHLPPEQRKIAEAAIKSARASRQSLQTRYGRESRSMSRQGPILSTARNQPSVQFPGTNGATSVAIPPVSNGLTPYRPLGPPPTTGNQSRFNQLPMIPPPSAEYPPAPIDTYPIPPQ